MQRNRLNLVTDPWRIVEADFDPARVEAAESLFALGNGVMGGRANFEERYSGPSLQGNYIGGVYYPDKTRVGWWKNGYPEYFAKVLNAAFWIGVDVGIDGEPLDLATVAEVKSFYRETDMRRSVLTRRMTVTMRNGAEVAVEATRFLSLTRRELGVVRYAVTPLNRAAAITFSPHIDADVRNADANYDEKFWEPVLTDGDVTQSRTRKSGFEAAWAQAVELEGAEFRCETQPEKVRHTAAVRCAAGRTATLYKYAGICSSLNHAPADLAAAARAVAADGLRTGFDALLKEQEEAWAARWHGCDIVIGGDPAAQQGIRFCIFMLLQTYTGVDTRLNIGPKGFTGEKYGGVTYWDTEAYCLPFYMATAGQAVARELLVYRYNQLDKAIENAAKLGFRDGAALYPMVTINGEECHNEWEITFEEIHRNGAIAYAIHNYIRYTGDEQYLVDCGLEVLVGIARFWAQRITWSEARRKYVLLGVTGPNEYENNGNNNWYTSYIACWSMRCAARAARWVRENRPADYARICAKRAFDEAAETAVWHRIADNMYLGEDRELGIFLQQDGYLDKEQTLVADLDPTERPINQKWSWDRILLRRGVRPRHAPPQFLLLRTTHRPRIVALSLRPCRPRRAPRRSGKSGRNVPTHGAAGPRRLQPRGRRRVPRHLDGRVVALGGRGFRGHVRPRRRAVVRSAAARDVEVALLQGQFPGPRAHREGHAHGRRGLERGRSRRNRSLRPLRPRGGKSNYEF